MKTLLIALLTLTTTIITAQNTVTWVGGTPGKETKWHEAKNWSNQRVPNEFSNVIIPDVSTTTFSSPVIAFGEVELNAILVESNAGLTVLKDAQLVIYGDAVGLKNKDVHIKGALIIMDETKENTIHATAVLSEN